MGFGVKVDVDGEVEPGGKRKRTRKEGRSRAFAAR